VFIKLVERIGEDVFSLILGPDTARASEAFASLLSYKAQSTIGKKIRSNTYSPIHILCKIELTREM
jgi:hypothetical protein